MAEAVCPSIKFSVLFKINPKIISVFTSSIRIVLTYDFYIIYFFMEANDLPLCATFSKNLITTLKLCGFFGARLY